MSGSNGGNMSSENKSDDDGSSGESKPSLTTATHKLKAEALRRYKLSQQQEGIGGVALEDQPAVAASLTTNPEAPELELDETEQTKNQQMEESDIPPVTGDEIESKSKNSATLQQEIMNSDDDLQERSGNVNAYDSHNEKGPETIDRKTDVAEATLHDSSARNSSHVDLELELDDNQDKSQEMSVPNDDMKPRETGDTSVTNSEQKESNQPDQNDFGDKYDSGGKIETTFSESRTAVQADSNNLGDDSEKINADSNNTSDLEPEVAQMIGDAQHHIDNPKSPTHFNTQISVGLSNENISEQKIETNSSNGYTKESTELTDSPSDKYKDENNQEPVNRTHASFVEENASQDLPGLKYESSGLHGLTTEGETTVAANETKSDNLETDELKQVDEQQDGKDVINTDKLLKDEQDESDKTGATLSEETTHSAEMESEINDKNKGTNNNNDSSMSVVKTEKDVSQVNNDEPYDVSGDVKTNTDAGNEGVENRDVLEPSERKTDEEDTKLADDFYYERSSSLLKPLLTEGVPQNLLSLHHSFGYECTKRENLHILDTNTVVFSAGNLVQILNLETMEQTYIGGTNSGGIGAITVHPSRQYFAVAEKGDKPNINIYEYPSLKLFRMLREGTLEAYAHLNFSPTGTKLASLGSSPDFMLTVWDWKNEKVILRSKAFSQDVYKVVFSPENEEHLCTSGTGHIRFWTMANTFTGLKLQGELGRFGTTELTDIEGFVELPDGKVLSGSEWGNMLLWDGGLIKVEICKKGNKLCHNGMIEQFFMDEGELMTIGADGFIKVWDFEGIDNADITDEENRVFEMEPMYEIKVGTDVKLKSMVKSVNPSTPTIWYGQDASGAIWKLDLSFTHTSHAPDKLFSYHAGSITCVEASPINHLVATCGLDCTVRLYDYVNKLSLCSAKYSSAATSLLWLPKIVDAKCTSILCGFSDGVVRYLSVGRHEVSASRSKRNKSNLEFQLVQVFKPHTKSVTSMVLGKRGKILATGSEDCTVFFFTVEDTCKPIGFIETASPVVSMSWLDNAPDPGGLLVFCKDGVVLDVQVPRLEIIDTNKTFRIPLQDLVKREYMFTRVKDKLLKAEEDERKARLKEEKQKRKEEERKRRRARGIEEEDEEEIEEEEEEEETKEEDLELVDHGPCVTIRGFPTTSLDKFWMLMDGWDAGYIYECEFPKESSKDAVAQEPISAIKLLECNDAPVRSYTYCNSGDFVLFGMENGVVRIHPVHGKNVLDSLTTYWSVHAHDSYRGAITAIRTSFDDKYVFTVGADGNFFVYNFMSDATLRESKPLSESSIPKLKTVIGEDGQEVAKIIDDIDDPNYYSIELEKQKAEHDSMVKIAEEKKQHVRRRIAKLRRSFKSLLGQNENLPEYRRIRAQELEIDPEIRKQQEARAAEKIDLVRKELAWESEKHSIGLKKLQDRFKSMVECDRIILYACCAPYRVSSLRSAKLSELYESLKESLWNFSEEKGVVPGKDQKKLSVGGVKGILPGKRRSTQTDVRKKSQSQQPTPGGQVGGKVAKALEKAEQRRMKRALRQAEWDTLYKNKPDENYQDPKDVSAIKEAKDNMGDYKLKTAEDYVVPEGQRVNAEIKLEQLLQLLQQIHHYKTRFNKRLLALRDKKINIIKEVKECVENLKRVQAHLDPSVRTPVPTVPEMKPEEIPERKLTYNKETLYSFQKQLAKKKDKADDDDGGGGGFGGFGVSESKPPQSTAGSRDRTFSNVSVLSGGRPKSNHSVKVSDQATQEAILENAEEAPTSLEIQLKKQEQIRMKYEQDRLLIRVQFLLTNFDGDVKTLRHEKSQYEVCLKNAELRHVTLFEELMLLKEFEKRESTFANRVTTKEDEKLDMEEKVESCQMKLDMKKEEIDKYLEQEKSLYLAFSSMIGENNKFEGFLTKVFKKKIKRAKKKDESQEGSDEDSDEDDSDEELSSSEESNSDEEALDDSVCPPGCDQALFDQVCELRENRLDIEESLAEEKKALETLKKEQETLNKKSKVIDSALNTAESELEAFQREKQQKLNELDVVVTIKLHQIQYMVNNSMPQDLSSCLIFINSDQSRLQKRIKELEAEKAEQKRLFREHRQMHVQLKRDKKGKEAEISDLEEKVKNMQMLKFGRLVDFERLENVSVNRNAEELKERLRQQEFKNATEISKWEKKIQAYREKLTLRTRENTERLKTSNLLYHERQSLERKLDSRQKSLGTEYSGNRKADLKERHRLVQLVQLQAQEIDALKDEITLLSRKGGHILPPSQPPLPASQTAIPNM